jgi:peroxisomal 3,2-trans-enoyl-CoA isomerase
MSEAVTVEYKGRVAIITIDNQKKLNALTQDQYYLLAKYMREVAEHEEVFITVLTGKGMSIPIFSPSLTDIFPGRYFSA